MKKKVIIIGAGYAGIRCMQKLSINNNLDITLIDKRAYHYLQTQAFSLVANSITLSDITVDLQCISKSNNNSKYIQAKVYNIDFVLNKIYAKNEEENITLNYDYIIIASGTFTNFPKQVEGLREFATGIKSLRSAFIIKQKFAKQLYSLMIRRKNINDSFYTIVIGGAGLSGVEIAAEMAQYSNEYLKRNHISHQKLNIYLICSSTNVLNTMNLFLQEKSEQRLKDLGVNIIFNTKITKTTKDIVYLSNNTNISYNYLIFTGGTKNSDFIEQLKCKKSQSGLLYTKDTLQLEDIKNAYAIGDIAYIKDKQNNQINSTAHVAEQSGEHVAKNILLDMKNKKQKVHNIKIEGYLVALGGHNAAVVLFKFIKVSGTLGYYFKKLITSFYKIQLDSQAQKIYKNNLDCN